MTLQMDITDVGRTTVSMAWKREWNDPGTPSGYHVRRAEPPALMEQIAMVKGRKFVDPDTKPSTSYIYEVLTIGLAVQETDSIQVTTRPPTDYANAVDFFDRFLAETFARNSDMDSVSWCPRWQEHREARVVVNELWRSYEAHRPPDDPLVPTTERAVWLTVFGYPLIERLWSPQGAFKGCWLSGGHGGVQPRLPG